MNVKEAIETRRAYRSLDPFTVTEKLVSDLAACAGLFCSCFNNQPWRYVFAYDAGVLERLHSALSRGNEWARDASLIIAVFSRKDMDCLIKEREYFLFDTGMATAALILRATELGLVAHPIAGFNEGTVKGILKIPEDMKVITLVIVGKHAPVVKPVLSDTQKEAELTRPPRLPPEDIVFRNVYSGKDKPGTA